MLLKYANTLVNGASFIYEAALMEQDTDKGRSKEKLIPV